MTVAVKDFELIKSIQERISFGLDIREKGSIQLEANEVLQQLLTLNFNSPVEVLQWVREYAPYSDVKGVFVPADDILVLFAQHGLFPGMCVGEQYRYPTKSQEAKWLIGQALSGLEIMSSMPNFIPFRITKFLNELLSF